ncbi:MAG: histidine phosphatase family protein [Cytophagales bacterium]|nr:histidine phosphatase family protein [Rhizobacter sp.]
MGTVYLVRHGQASFGADNYDQLSDLGHRQCERLGEYFRHKGISFDAALVGTLQRQVESLAGIAKGMQWDAEPLSWPGLNEYDSKAVVTAIHPEPLPKPTSPELVRHHFRLLRDGLAQWMAGTTQPEGMPSYGDFVAGITDALDHVRGNHLEKKVLIVSSGGPISTAVGHVLGMSPEATIDLNMRIRNSSVTEFAFTPKRHVLVTYNTLPHLDHPDHAAWITHT